MNHKKDLALYSSFFVISVIFTAFSVIYTDETGFEHYENGGDKTKIYDAGHQVIPRLHIEKSLFYYVSQTVPYIFALASEKRILILKDFFLIAGMLFVIRAISISLTLLPKLNCDVESKNHNMEKFLQGGSYDKIFSGHTGISVVITLVLIYYGVWPQWAMAYPLFVAWMMISTRGHYTVDVFLGYVIATLLFLVVRGRIPQ